MAEYTEKQLERMVYSKKWYRRAEAANHGYGLDILVHDENPSVRCVVAEQGYGLESLVHDVNWMVKSAVAEQVYGLDILVRDMSGVVRMAVARQGYGLDALLNDSFSGARGAARTYIVEHLEPEVKELFSVPLSELGLSSRIINCLGQGGPGGVRTVGELALASDAELLQRGNIGVKSLASIKEKFVAYFNDACLETALELFKDNIEAVIGAPVNDEKWFIRTTVQQLEKQKGYAVDDLLVNATLRSELSADSKMDKQLDFIKE